MSDAEIMPLLPPDEAVVAWCDPGLVAAVRAAERPFAPEALMLRERPHLGGGRAEYRPSERVYSDYLRTENHVLDHAWERLILDFRRRIERESLFLCGVPSGAKDGGPRQPIPNAWAADLEFDFVKSTVTRFLVRYVSVRCSLAPIAQAAVERGVAPPAGSETPIRHLQPREIGDLSDEMVLALLEEHARRVAEDDSSPLISPSKISYGPILVRRMRYRAEHGQIEATLSAEARVLAGWIAEKVPSHQVPKEGSVRNAVRPAYNALKAQSTRTNA